MAGALASTALVFAIVVVVWSCCIARRNDYRPDQSATENPTDAPSRTAPFFACAGNNFGAFAAYTLIAVLVTLAWHPGIWQAAAHGYPGDSFHTLSALAATGLVGVSAVLGTGLTCLSWHKTRLVQHQSPGVHPLIGFVVDQLLTMLLFWTAVSLAPQLYYLYYLLVFDALPAQWVIRAVSLREWLHLGRLPADGNLADHFTGLVLWVMLVTSWLSWLALAHGQFKRFRDPTRS